MNTVYFQNLPKHLCRHLSEARISISAAVCWFSNKDIFERLLERLRSGVSIVLLLEYDSQNIREGGLDFQQFIRLGGQLWACRDSGLMHHKFALLDNRLLLTGSFNWTYNSNAENLLATEDERTLAAFQEEFDRQKATAQRIFQVRRCEAKLFAAFPLFEKTLFPLADLRKKISHGASVWLFYIGNGPKHCPVVFAENLLPFDATKHLAAFWTAFRMWDEAIFDEEIERLEPLISPSSRRILRLWARRMKIGDLVFAWRKNNACGSNALIAIGIIQSHPQPFSGEGFSSFRSVQWLKIMEEMPYLLPDKISGQAVAKYKGSALRVLQEVFGG